MACYFTAQYMLYDSNGYAITMEEDCLKNLGGMKLPLSSVHFFPCKLLGLSYPDYLRYCRSKYNARLVGKRGIYTYPVFDDKKDCDKLIKILNDRLDFLLKKC